MARAVADTADSDAVSSFLSALITNPSYSG